MDHVWEDQLRVREFHGSPDEVPKACGAIDFNGLFGDRGATLQADGAEEARKAKEMVSMKMCDEDLGNSPFRLRGKNKIGNFSEVKTHTKVLERHITTCIESSKMSLELYLSL